MLLLLVVQRAVGVGVGVGVGVVVVVVVVVVVDDGTNVCGGSLLFFPPIVCRFD